MTSVEVLGQLGQGERMVFIQCLRNALVENGYALGVVMQMPNETLISLATQSLSVEVQDKIFESLG